MHTGYHLNLDQAFHRFRSAQHHGDVFDWKWRSPYSTVVKLRNCFEWRTLCNKRCPKQGALLQRAHWWNLRNHPERISQVPSKIIIKKSSQIIKKESPRSHQDIIEKECPRSLAWWVFCKAAFERCLFAGSYTHSKTIWSRESPAGKWIWMSIVESRLRSWFLPSSGLVRETCAYPDWIACWNHAMDVLIRRNRE